MEKLLLDLPPSLTSRSSKVHNASANRLFRQCYRMIASSLWVVSMLVTDTNGRAKTRRNWETTLQRWGKFMRRRRLKRIVPMKILWSCQLWQISRGLSTLCPLRTTTTISRQVRSTVVFHRLIAMVLPVELSWWKTSASTARGPCPTWLARWVRVVTSMWKVKTLIEYWKDSRVGSMDEPRYLHFPKSIIWSRSGEVNPSESTGNL